MDTSVVTLKGQIVIPVALRKKAGIKQGTKVFLEERHGDIIVHPATRGFYEKNCGILKGRGLLRALLKSRRKEREREERRLERA